MDTQNSWFKVRREKPSDYDEVYQLVKLSFAASRHSDGTEADYLNDLRKKETFIPSLSLVAEKENGGLIGQIVLSGTEIITPWKPVTELLLSPLCVHPLFFRRGIARAMMTEGFRRAKKMGYAAVFLCGDPEVYKISDSGQLLSTVFSY
ncbi:N-acetyltransferase [Brucepastera parasyntrophica]|uniref:GNAT family N-acetyltransferase n=1 Tax=Brucepastera parasyntrophica TaxID=2880008 RepID=UPI002109869C|nr:N-acetyltransferase [Brucepastera parasyntrophica]ULQ58911.1 N-acetyltransferase [Brucepastera parasyntrophica]